MVSEPCAINMEQSVMPTNHLHFRLVIVIKRLEFDRWSHAISTSGHGRKTTFQLEVEVQIKKGIHSLKIKFSA